MTLFFVFTVKKAWWLLFLWWIFNLEFFKIFQLGNFSQKILFDIGMGTYFCTKSEHWVHTQEFWLKMIHQTHLQLEMNVSKECEMEKFTGLLWINIWSLFCSIKLPGQDQRKSTSKRIWPRLMALWLYQTRNCQEKQRPRQRKGRNSSSSRRKKPRWVEASIFLCVEGWLQNFCERNEVDCKISVREMRLIAEFLGEKWGGLQNFCERNKVDCKISVREMRLVSKFLWEVCDCLQNF